MFKTYEYIDKIFYSPIEDENIVSGGYDITKENYNILGDDITSEASDIILGAENCCTLDTPQVCTRNTVCTDDNMCVSNCLSDKAEVIKDVSCLEDGSGEIVTGTTKQSGYVLTYIGVKLYGYLSGQTESKYEVNWLSGYTGDWGKVKLYVTTGGTMPCNFASTTTGMVLTQSGTSNYYYTYYTVYVSDIEAYPDSYSTTLSAKIDIPGHYQATCGFNQRTITGLTTAYCLSTFETYHSAGTPASAMCNQITISHSVGSPSTYNNLKYGNVTYTMYSPDSQSVSEPVQVYTAYSSPTNVLMSPSIVVHCPYQYFLVSRSRPGITYPIKAVCNVSTINGSSAEQFYNFVSNTVTASTKVAKLSELKSMVLKGSPTGYTSVNKDNVCLRTSLSTYNDTSCPFGFYCSGHTKTSNKVLLASEILGVDPTALPALFGSSYNAGTWTTLKTYVSVAPTVKV